MRINPKNFFNRKLQSLPPHFTTTSKFLNEYDQQKVDSWIHENCVGRYCMIKDVKWSGNSWKAVTTIGFEEPSDMTLFGLSGLLQTKLPN